MFLIALNGHSAGAPHQRQFQAGWDMAPRLPSLDGTPIGFGHRGAMAEAPENTIESFELAVSKGASGIETDVWCTADNIAVLSHDGRVGSKLRRRAIRALTQQELPEHIPSADDLYRSIGTVMPLSIDVKEPAAFEPLIAAARQAGPEAESNLWICHPSVKQLMEWRGQTTANLVNSTRLAKIDEGAERRAARLASSGIEAINLFHSDWTGGLISLFHRFGRRAFGWGLQHEREFAVLVDAGIDAVYSDHVDRMMAAINEYYH